MKVIGETQTLLDYAFQDVVLNSMETPAQKWLASPSVTDLLEKWAEEKEAEGVESES